MTKTLVERLRDPIGFHMGYAEEAADKIERYQAALESIAAQKAKWGTMTIREASGVAREALGDGPSDEPGKP